MSEFITELDAACIDDKTWRLNAPLVYFSSLLGRSVRVPRGFETDFASVPRVPVAYMLFGDRAHHEAVIHDYLYRMDSVPIVDRKTADAVFLEAMKARGKGAFVRYSMYLGVRLGGWTAYHKKRVKDRIC